VNEVRTISIKPSKTYNILRSKVRDTFLTGLKRIEAERVRTYWKTGQLIHSHILQFKDRADHGKRVVARLAEDLDIEKTVLNRTIQFYRQFPQLGGEANVARGQHLSWSQYRTLLPVADRKLRLDLARRAETGRWTQLQLMEEVRKTNGKLTPQPVFKKTKKLIRPSLGPRFHHRIVEEVSKRFVDLGFGTHIPVEHFKLGNIRAGEIVRSHRESDGTYRLKKTTRVSKKDVFIYDATVIRVIDGDTIWMHIDLGFNIFKKVKIRLLGIDTPPLTDSLGKKAKAYVESLTRQSPNVIVRSTRSGKFDRYLGAVFIATPDKPPSYLNQLLLNHSLATVHT